MAKLTELLIHDGTGNKVVVDYIVQNTPEIIQMAFGKMINDHAQKERWPTPWRLVATNGKGELCVDFSATPGQPHAFVDIAPAKLLCPPWNLTVTAKDGRQINRTVTLAWDGKELVWACDGDEIERWGLVPTPPRGSASNN